MSKFPCWMYGPGGQSDIFNNPEDIPDGWADHPKLVGQSNSKKQTPKPKAAAKPKAAPKAKSKSAVKKPEVQTTPVTSEDTKINFTREELMKALQDREIAFEPDASLEALYEMTLEAVEAES